MPFLDSYELSLIVGESSRQVKKVSERKDKIMKKRTYRKSSDVIKGCVEYDFETDSYFTREKFTRSLNFYDFEVFQYDWLVVIINPIDCTRTFIVNDSKALEEYYERHKKEVWVGYNSHDYDRYIIKGILLGMNPKEVSDSLIYDKLKGWQISDEFRNVVLYDFDIMNKRAGSLKTMEAYMGNDINETSVPFDIDRILTRNEINSTFKYCNHDVEQTMEVFKYRINEYNAHVDLLKTFEMKASFVSLTKAQLTAQILECKRIERHDEFDIQFVDTIRLDRYRHIMDWFKNKSNMNYDKSLTANVCGIPHNFGWGGLHGCAKYPVHTKGKIFHADVTSFYPSLMIEYDFLTRNCIHKEKFKEIYDKRVELKRQGKKAEQAPYKIVLNSTYGITKDKYSSALDSRQANCICINGQLLLLDLLEKLEPYVELINSNTDGIIVKVNSEENESMMRKICNEWSKRTRMGLGLDEITEIWQTPDVNSYIFRFANGKLERKGAYAKESNPLDNNLSIVNEAVVRFLTEGKSVEDTVNECEDLGKFQMVVKVSDGFIYAWHNGERLRDRTFRVFASKDVSDTFIGRSKIENGTVMKFADTPENCFIDNGDIKEKKIPPQLDRRWYVNLAKKRIRNKYGVDTDMNTLGL